MEEKKVVKKETKVKAEDKKEKKSGKKGTIIGISIAGVVVIAIAVTLVVLINNGVFTKLDITGTYSLVGMKDGERTYTKDDLQLLKSFGLTVSLELREDKTGTLNLFGDKTEFTYDSKNLIMDGEKTPYTLNDNEITMEHNGSSLTFSKAVEDDTTETTQNPVE